MLVPKPTWSALGPVVNGWRTLQAILRGYVIVPGQNETPVIRVMVASKLTETYQIDRTVVDIIRAVFLNVFGRVTVSAQSFMREESELEPSPMPADTASAEVVEKCETRIKNLRSFGQINDKIQWTFMAVETFLEKTENRWQETTCVVLMDPVRKIALQCTSAPTYVPVEYADVNRAHTELYFSTSETAINRKQDGSQERSSPERFRTVVARSETDTRDLSEDVVRQILSSAVYKGQSPYAALKSLAFKAAVVSLAQMYKQKVKDMPNDCP